MTTCIGAVRKSLVAVALTCGVLVLTLGMTCDVPGTGPLNPPVPPGNRPPRVTITGVITPSNDMFAERGEPINVQMIGNDGEDVATVRVFASRTATPTPADEIPIAAGLSAGPGEQSLQVLWDTSNVPVGTYFVFAEIADGTFDPNTGAGNPPVRAVSAGGVQIAPRGSRPQNDPPRLEFLSPLSNLGLSSEDDLTIRYNYADRDDAVTVTLLLDKDQNPNNDDVNNPGDPLDPNSKIIILPSEARHPTDPTFDGDPPPPDNPNNPPGQADSLEVRKNPRTMPATAPTGQPVPGATFIGEEKTYIFTIDFSKIPVRNEPYFIRATITDGNRTVHAYATGSLTITALAEGIVDINDVGFRLAGVRLQGFGAGDNLGSDLVGVPDIDGDGQDEMLLAARFGSPRNRAWSGSQYLIFGRRKVPFPPDTNGNGLPDVTTQAGVVDFPVPPTFVANPYNAQNVGRFGGELSINSVNSFFRGTTYAMPEPHGQTLPPAALQDPGHPGVLTSGVTSLTRLDLSGDGVADLVFGIPFVSGALEYHDDDPVDGGCDVPYGDGYPHEFRCEPRTNDDIVSERSDPWNAGDPVDQGLVIVVDGTNDINTVFRALTDACMAGQFDPGNVYDDEGFLVPPARIPQGFRLRGGWWDANGIADPPINRTSQFGRSVARLPSIDNDLLDELVVSAPGLDGGRGGLFVWLGQNFQAEGWFVDGVQSFPQYASLDCIGTDPTICVRGFVPYPAFTAIIGAFPGDNIGVGESAGTFNQDGVADIMAGAPGADRDGRTDNGVFYVFFTPAGGFGNTNLFSEDIPRMEVRGTHDGDGFGAVQAPVRDMNGDGIDDVAFASESFDDDILGNQNAGYVGVIFGNRPLTGERGFSPDQVGTPQLSGIRFLGPTINARAGHDIATAGDFNRDGFGDLLISAPGEVRRVGNEDRPGVVYLIFGGTHLINKTFHLSAVGSPELPGMVFLSRFARGTENEAPLETVGGLGDVDGDGFDDIAIGAPHADFVNTASPNQRRIDAGEIYIVYGNNFGSNNLGP